MQRVDFRDQCPMRQLPRWLSIGLSISAARAVNAVSAIAIQMLDVHFPTTDGRTLILSR
jgi:hypothetical protein